MGDNKIDVHFKITTPVMVFYPQVFKIGSNPLSDIQIPKGVRELDVSGNQFYKLHKVIAAELFRIEVLNMAAMQLTEV